MEARVLRIDACETAVRALKGLIEACQKDSLVGVLARRLECSAATLYNWRETKDEETALQRLLRIALVKGDEQLQDISNAAREFVAERIEV